MKRNYILYFIILALFTACDADELELNNSNDKENRETKTLYVSSNNMPHIQKGEIRIKLSKSIGDNISITKPQGIVQSNVSQLNVFLNSINANKMQRLFPYAGKFEERTRKEGLHLWYKVNFDKNIPVSTALDKAEQISGVEIVENVLIPKVSSNKAVEAPLFNPNPFIAPAEEEGLPFNDPKLIDQWHYNNTGAFGKSKKGADINLFEAWKREIGKPNVIVCVVDGGVDYSHEDLKDNMHINTAELNGTAGVDDDGNGYIDDIYGYNFVSGSGNITAIEHGTHVAGTVAARNNNGIGVCGVAGGDGTPDSGIRMISAQIFEDAQGGDTPAALKYGADNGAVISQNSWGYPFPGPGYLPASEREAIDYFVKYAGCDNNGNQLADSPMKGGIVIFAAGNDDRDFLSYPAAYEATVAVASMAPNFKKAYYSTYGKWVDITAPGGDLNFPKGEVLSTLPGNRYGYMQGTSMACPHVSGIAALIASKFGGPGFTSEDLRQRLLTGLRPKDIDEENPDYKGKLGVGYIDAYRVLAVNENKAPGNPTFISVVPDFISMEIKWKAVGDEDDVVPDFYRLYYSEEVLNESNYKTADFIKISAAGYEEGETITYLVKDLPLNTQYYFAVDAVDRWGLTSQVDFTEGKTKENHAPIIKREDNSLIKLTGKQVVSLNLIVEEPDNQDWTCEIEGHQNGVVYKKEQNAINLTFRALEPFGRYKLKVIVKDVFGAKAEIKIPFEYYENQAPIMVKPLEKVYTPLGKTYNINLSDFFRDPEETKLTYTAKSLNGSILGVNVKENILTVNPLKLGLGAIDVTVTDEAGATTYATITVQVVNDNIVYVAYPIPVDKMLNVRLSNDVNNAKLTVRSTTGASVFKKEVTVANDNRLVVLNLGNLSAGAYVLYAEANGKTFKQSFIKY